MQLWTDSIFEGAARSRTARPPHRIGLLPGEGIGPQVTRIAARVLEALRERGLADLDVRVASPLPDPPPADPLEAGLAGFCAATFAAGGSILAGPYGGRFVYDLRRRFDLFCKLSPLVPSAALRDVVRLRPEVLEDVDVLVVRENAGGIYQGSWSETVTPAGERVAEHRFHYAERDVARVLRAGARLAAARRGALAVVVKPGGIPSVSRLWCDCAAEVARAHGVAWQPIEVDYAAYLLVQEPSSLDVVVAPNLAADVLSDVGAVLLGSRGLSFGGSFSAGGAAVYQTNHGAAFDLAGTDRANPAGHLLALAMLLRQSHALHAAADTLEAAIESVWAEGVRTADLAGRNGPAAGTAETGDRIVDAIRRLRVRRPALDVAS